MAKAAPVRRDTFAPHAQHEKHLCEMVRKRNMAEAAKASKGARFICHICGRAAAKADSLCEPIDIP